MKKITIACIAGLLIPGALAAQITAPGDLDRYRWKNRLVLLFAETPSNSGYLRQIEQFREQVKGFRERDLVLFHLFDKGTSYAGSESQIISESGTKELFLRFEVPPGDFTILLIGKDGSEKLRSDTVLETARLFEVIDAMPMRQREMRNSGRKH